jgi:large subunit ribosomal protein L29
VKAREIREMTQEELEQRLRERHQALKNFKLQQATGVVDNVRGARNARRDIARIKTILHARELAASGGSK